MESERIERQYQDSQELYNYLLSKGEVSFATYIDSVYKKVLVLSAASYFESKVSELISKYATKVSGSDKRIVNLIESKVIERPVSYTHLDVYKRQLLSWRHFPKGHTPCSRSFRFQGSMSPDKTHFTGKTGPLPYVQNDGKWLEISIFPRLWNHGIMVINGRIFLMRGGF